MQWTAEGSVLVPSVFGSYLCMKYLRNRWTDLRQIHTEDVFGPSNEFEGQGHQEQKKTAFFGHFGSLCAVYVW